MNSVLRIRGAALAFAWAIAATSFAGETAEEKRERMQWFTDAKLGVFIHWGIYAVNGIDESWSFYNGYIGYEDYMKQLAGFTAARYDPDHWARLIQESGARYAVLTSKHHDGVALWDTRLSELNVLARTPAGRDLVAPYCAALRRRDLKVGLYFSHLDWSHPDYPHFTSTVKRYERDSTRWARFVAFRDGQVEELMSRYTPDLLWFDGDWDYPADVWRAKELRERIRSVLPRSIVNSRINGCGDYATPEQGIPVVAPREVWWELCLTMNDSWGYQGNDRNYKTPNQIIRIFVDCLDMGGNLLLDVGPMADGTIPGEQIAILRELGRWTRKHAEAIYGTSGRIPPGHFRGPMTLSKDRRTLYLFLEARPIGPLLVKGLKNRVQRARVVGAGTKLAHKVIGKQYWSDVPGLLSIDVPGATLDPQVTVIALLLDGPLDLYGGGTE